MHISNQNFLAFVDQYKILFDLSNTRFNWNINYDPMTGRSNDGSAWTLNELSLNKTKLKHYLNNFSIYPVTATNTPVLLSDEWILFLKAEVARRCLELRNSVGLVFSVVGAIRLLAGTTKNKSPWLITISDIIYAYEKAVVLQPSGVLAGRVLELAKNPFDVHLLSNFCPVIHKVKRPSKGVEKRKTHVAISTLNDRLNANKLPLADEFNALVEILSSRPQRHVDEILFPAIKLMLIMGFRINEVCMIPAEWKSEEIEYDQHGKVVIDNNGKILKTLYINYFAEKQDKSELYEPRRVPAPHSFQEHVDEILTQVKKITEAFRQKLRLHEKSNNTQLFDDVEQGQFIELEDFCAAIGSIAPPEAIFAGVKHHLYMPRERILKAYLVPRYEKVTGCIIPWTERSPLANEKYKVSEIEAALIGHFKTKLSTIEPAISIGSEVLLKASDVLFLLPRKAKAKESKSGWFYDWNRYLFVSRLSPQNIDKALNGEGNDENIFKIYLGRDCRLNSHSLRHLRSAELIRAKVSDMIHAKTMGRKSYAQNYEYDHRSVSESLAQFNIEEAILNSMPPKALELLGKIATNQIGGSISKTFRELQLDFGDEKAIEWLAAHADAMHLTPYGVCVANMVTNPCPKHLQCFTGCTHYVSDNRAESKQMLEELKQRHINTIQVIRENQDNGAYGGAQLAHAEKILNGIQLALDSRPKTNPFQDGKDLFVDAAIPKGKTALDRPIQVEINYESKY